MPGYAGPGVPPVDPTEPNQLPRLLQRFWVEGGKQPAGTQDGQDSSLVSLRTRALELEYVVWQYNLRRELLAHAVRWPSARGSTTPTESAPGAADSAGDVTVGLVQSSAAGAAAPQPASADQARTRATARVA